MSDLPIVVWEPVDVVVIPPGERDPKAIVARASGTLSSRDIASIGKAFEAESYEMASTFVWTKAAATLKKQLSSLGMEFVGEMLARPDISADSDPASIGDHEVISLAEDLGVITETQGLKLKHALQLVAHYAKMDPSAANEDPMQHEEAVVILKTCVGAILGQPTFTGAIRFAEFRTRLGSDSLRADDESLSSLGIAPYFFVRTTLSALLAMMKTAKGATLEHASGNSVAIIPNIWTRLRENEKWQVGQAYAEVSASGNQIASASLKKALLSVHGFDFVPESLRSGTFTEAAARLLSAHFGMNNFYKEEEPMETLANLGTSIPMPALAKCMEATLAVWLGNFYGHTFNAEHKAGELLGSLRPNQWEYYLNHCLPRDRTVLDKISSDDRPVSRWRKLVLEKIPENIAVNDKSVREILEISRATVFRPLVLKQVAQNLRFQMKD